MKEWQKLSPSETIILRDIALSDVSVDMITIFGIRPPELRFVQRPELFYKWFYRTKEPIIKGDIKKQLESLRDSYLHWDVHESAWIDGLGHQLFVRPKAVTQVLDWLHAMDDDRKFYCGDHQVPLIVPTIARDSMVQLFEELQLFSDPETNMNEDEAHAETLRRFFGPCMSPYASRSLKDLPIIWYDPIPPTQGHRFVIHLLLSMGQFDNEMNLFTHQTMRQCFEYASLISKDIQDEETLLSECRTLLHEYVVQQLVFQPCGTKQFDRFLVAAWQVIRECIVHNEIPFRELPACLYTQLSRAIEESESKFKTNAKRVMCETVLDNLSKKGIETGCDLQQLMKASVENPADFPFRLKKGDSQSIESFEEQTQLFEFGKSKLIEYMSAQTYTTKCLIINGGPGTGKTTLMELLMIFAQHLGLTSTVTAVMAERSSQLGGTHIAQLMCVPVEKGVSFPRQAEMGYISLCKSLEKLSSLHCLDIMFIDEFGQVSAELLSTMDMILRRARNSTQFLGGVLIITTYDYQQLQPVEGHPPLLSPHILTSFVLKKLDYSVRAGNDPDLRRIQDYTRLSPRKFAQYRDKFISDVVKYCTFVDRFDDPAIPTTTLRMFGKKKAAIVATETLLEQMKLIYGDSMVPSYANDQEATVEGVFVSATLATSQFLTTKVKEPIKLWFYPDALYQITYNKKNHYNQSQLAMLHHIPELTDITEKKPIDVVVAPPGCKSLPSDSPSCQQLIEQHGWKRNKVGVCADRIHTFRSGIQAKRLQYGLQPRIASTIHSAMGQDLPSIVSRVTSEDDNNDYNLWTKEQVIVLLSRTHYAKDIIFVGDKFKTAEALADCLQHVSQYTDFMAHIMDVLTRPMDEPGPIFLDPYMYSPFSMCHYSIQNTAGSWCYHLLSLGDPTKSTSYIGETGNLAHRIIQHNQGQGSSATREINLIPWALLGYVTSFQTDQRSLRQKFENDWKAHRDARARQLGRRLKPGEIGGVAVYMIQHNEEYHNLLYVRCGRMRDETEE